MISRTGRAWIDFDEANGPNKKKIEKKHLPSFLIRLDSTLLPIRFFHVRCSSVFSLPHLMQSIDFTGRIPALWLDWQWNVVRLRLRSRASCAVVHYAPIGEIKMNLDSINTNEMSSKKTSCECGLVGDGYGGLLTKHTHKQTLRTQTNFNLHQNYQFTWSARGHMVFIYVPPCLIHKQSAPFALFFFFFLLLFLVLAVCWFIYIASSKEKKQKQQINLTKKNGKWKTTTTTTEKLFKKAWMINGKERHSFAIEKQISLRFFYFIFSVDILRSQKRKSTQHTWRQQRRTKKLYEIFTHNRNDM